MVEEVLLQFRTVFVEVVLELFEFVFKSFNLLLLCE